MSLIRTFHPIGQGAFYTERYSFNGSEFTIVYDCGSTTLKGKKLAKKITSTFPKGQPIDILFISHFHADHINGIEDLSKHCKIQKVVMPLIDSDAKILLKVSNLIESNFSDTRLIDNAEVFFGRDVPIIRIEPSVLNLDAEGIVPLDPIDISNIVGSQVMPSGTVFTGSPSNDWLFIPFNYEHSRRYTQFVSALEVIGLALTDIDTIEKIKVNFANIRKAYDKIDGDLNKNSMILFSGKATDDHINCLHHFHHYYFHKKFPIQSGCLFTGDIDLNEPHIVDDINAKLKQLLPRIGTLQVPHHGSLHNFSTSILKKENCCAIVSYGTTNTYGHPSDRVIGDIISNGIYLHLVTEEQTTIVTQWK